MTPGTILTISLESEQNSVSQAGTERLTCHLNEETRGGGCRIREQRGRQGRLKRKRNRHHASRRETGNLR